MIDLYGRGCDKNGVHVVVLRVSLETNFVLVVFSAPYLETGLIRRGSLLTTRKAF